MHITSSLKGKNRARKGMIEKKIGAGAATIASARLVY